MPGCGFCQCRVSSVGAGLLELGEHALSFYLPGMTDILSMGPGQEPAEQQLARGAQLRMMESGHGLATKTSVFSLLSRLCQIGGQSLGCGYCGKPVGWLCIPRCVVRLHG